MVGFKKLTSILLALIILSLSSFLVFSEEIQPSTSVNYLPGDVDGNGIVDITDVTVFQLTLINKLDKTEAFLKNSNTYTDQKTNIRDATVIQLYLVGKFQKIPITPDGYYSEILRP